MFSKEDEIEFAKFYMQIFNSERNKIKTCFYPGCNEKQINSHILQKNGILSGISENKHLYTSDVNMFDENSFVIKKIGLNKAYSFPCFCSYHDSNIFSEIENKQLDYGKYKTFLLFTIRTALNELFRKSVMVKVFDHMKSKYEHLNNSYSYNEFQKNQILGVSDLQKLIDVIWKDLNEDTESFVFLHRKISKLEICTSAFYNYETTKELKGYININGKDKEDVSQIFFNFFPLEYQSILMMGYLKKDELLTKQYVNQFFKTSEKKVQRMITNRILFQIETWACSPKFYLEKMKNKEFLYKKALYFSNDFPLVSERKNFDINFYKEDFNFKLKSWNKKYYS